MKKYQIILIIICLFSYHNVFALENNYSTVIKDKYEIIDQNNIQDEVVNEIEKEINDSSIDISASCQSNYCDIHLSKENAEIFQKKVQITQKNQAIIDENNSNFDTNTPGINKKTPSISYNSHIQYVGWQGNRVDGQMSGTSGLSLRMESLIINLTNAENSQVEYISYIQGSGWEDNWKSNGIKTGTEGNSLRLEAIKIRLVGDILNYYDIYYRVHVQDYGWLGWAKNEEIAGTIGYDKQIEAIEIKLVEKQTGELTGNSYHSTGDIFKYQAHIQDIGWQNYVEQGIAGTENTGLRLEAVNIKLVNTNYSGGIEYASYVENVGWQGYVKQGISGTIGWGYRLEAIKIRLTGQLSSVYDIYYRVKCQNFGWLGWAKNDEIAGTMEFGLKMEAIEIKLVPKGTGEVTGNSYQYKDVYLSYQTHVQNIGDQVLTSEGNIAGTTGQGLRVEGIKMNISTNLAGNIIYQTYIQGKGWQEEKTTGQQAGTIGEGCAIRLIKIKLDGDLESKYDIYYRVHSAKFGWFDWAKNGEVTGAEYYNIQAIQIKLYLKNDPSKNSLPTSRIYTNIIYPPEYYSQADPRWAKIKYGRSTMRGTGCAPTSMAMAFTSILDRSITPVDVANYLYYQTNEFNKYTTGSSGLAIIYATNYFGVGRTPLKTVDDLRYALITGKIIFAEMGNGKFATPYYNHAIILYSYNNAIDSAYAYDPLKSQNNGMVSLSQLWSEQIDEDDDLTPEGGNFYALYAI